MIKRFELNKFMNMHNQKLALLTFVLKRFQQYYFNLILLTCKRIKSSA